MKLFPLSRAVHKWVAIVTFIPMGAIFVTGILLAVSPQVPLFQPPAVKPSDTAIRLGLDDILASARTVPEARIQSFEDIVQIDIRPKTGIIRVRAKDLWEIQLDGATGEVLAAHRRWKTLFITLHDGSWFGPLTRYGLFLPTGGAALLLWISGIYLFFFPWLKKRSRSS